MKSRIAVAAVLACCASGASQAADWQFNPKVVAQAESDDNSRLTITPGEEIEVQGLVVDAQAEIRALTPTSDFRLTPRGKVSIYPDEEDDETNLAALMARWDYRGEKARVNLDAGYSQRTVLGRFFPDGSNPDDGGLGEPGQGAGSGRSTEKTDQNEFIFRPRLRYSLTERTSLLLRAGYQNVEFDDQVVSDRQNFDDVEGAVGIGFQTSPTTSIDVMAGASRFSPDGNLDNDSQFLNVGWSKEVSDVSRIYVNGGATRNKVDAPGADWENGFNGGAGIQWQFEVTELFLEYNHYIDPSASGQLVNRDQLRFQLFHNFSERSSINLAARAIQDEDWTSENAFETRQFFSGLAEYEWRFRQEWSLFAGYEYTWREYEDDPTYAQSNRLFAGVRYQPNRGAGMYSGIKRQR